MAWSSFLAARLIVVTLTFVLPAASDDAASSLQRRLLAAAPFGGGMGGKNPLTAEFNDFVRHKMDEWKVPGLSLAVVDGEAIYNHSYGYATLPGEQSPGERASADTLWYGGSTTKAQLAATLAQLIDSKAYPELVGGWATAISSVIRNDFVLQDAWATDHITLEDAVSHRNGMPWHDKSSAHTVNGTAVTVRDVVRNLRNLPLIAEPRVTWLYCNLMYVTLGHVVETLTGHWLGRVLRHVIWQPLGMNSIYLGLEAAWKAPNHLATGYYWDIRTKSYNIVSHMATQEIDPAGGVISTVVDYARWVRCLLHKAHPFSDGVHDDIRRPRMVIGPCSMGDTLGTSTYALGWQRLDFKGHVVYTHSGGLDSFAAQVYWLPGPRFGAVAFGNTALTAAVVEDIIIYRLIEDRLGIPKRERWDSEKRWREIIASSKINAQDAEKLLYPDRPDPPLPSSFSINDLAGRYWSPVYGEFSLRQEPHPSRPGHAILVADRENMTWRYQLSIYHVSGDYWIVYGTTPHNPTFIRDFQRAHFMAGVDGKVSGLEIDWKSALDSVAEGKAFFQRLPQLAADP